MSVFISYARRDEEQVKNLARDIERTRREVWVDERLTGGQAWWDTILDEIRRCDLFVSALSPDAVKSRACTLELEYAVALGKTVLPVIVRDVALQLAPPVLANAQAIWYTDRTADAVLELTTALASARPSGPLPPTEPPRPPVPITYLDSVQQKVAAASLSFHEQTALLVELRTHAQSDDVRDLALLLLRDLRRRADIVESVGREVDAILAEAAVAAGSGTTTAAAWHPDPFKRFELRYWDGNAWTEHVVRSGQRFLDAPTGGAAANVAAGGSRQPVHTFTAPSGAGGPAPSVGGGGPSTVPAFTPGAFIGLLLATVFCGGVVGIVTGAMNLKHPARKGQSVALIAIGLGLLVVGLIAAALNAANQSNSGF